MLTTLKKLWNDERGFVNSMELILIATLAVLGLIVGLVTLRDAVTQELADTGAAVGNVNQSYSVFVDGNSIDPNDGPQIISDGPQGMVTVNRNFQQQLSDDPMDPPVTIVSVSSTFNNFLYEDQTDIGDGQDSANTAPPGIITMLDPASDEGS